MVSNMVTLCNNNPKSPNAIEYRAGIFGGITSRDKYIVHEATPVWPFDYSLWHVRDLQIPKCRWVNVSSIENDFYYCQKCNANNCEHVMAVKIFESEKHKEKKALNRTMAEHTDFVIAHNVKITTSSSEKEQDWFWAGARIYANRHGVEFKELVKNLLLRI